MKGHCTSHYLAEILRDLYFEESTGAIEIATPTKQSVRLHFDRGMLYFGESSAPQDSLQNHLTAAGLVAPSALAKLAEATPSPELMAARLVSSQAATREEMAPVVRSVVQACVSRAFSWPSGSHEFLPKEAAQGFFDPDILFTFECILKGIGGMAHFGPLKDVLLRLPGKVRLSDKVFLPVERLALKPQHGYVLSRADGSMRMQEIALLLPPEEEEESVQFLYGLAVLGIIEFDPPLSAGPFSLRDVMHDHYASSEREERESTLIRESARKLLSQGPAEVLGVAPEASIDEVRAAFDQRKKAFQRDRFSERVREKHKRDLALIENKLAEAFLKLEVERLERAGNKARSEASIKEVNPDTVMVRREMVKTAAQEEQEQNTKLAEQYFNKARDYFGEQDYHNCIQFCRLAIKFHEESAPVHALMAEALARNPNSRWQRMAEEAYTRACELDPWNAEYHVALGKLYREQGLDIRARKQFEKALEILPSHAEAKAEMKVTKARGNRH